MAGLKGKAISSVYKSLLRVNDDTNGVDTSATVVTDGEGTNSCFWISDDVMLVKPDNDDSAVTFRVSDAANNAIFNVDTTNSRVRAGVGQFNVLTQYAYFGVNFSDFSSSVADTHYPIPFSAASGGATLANDVDFGTGTDPDTTFTTANTDTQYAAQIVPMMWFVPDNISIDSVTSIEGADNVNAETTRMHLMSFTFNSASTSCLTAGELLAHNSDVTNAGNEQAYKSTWTIDEASVSADKVILAFFRSDSTVSSDYSLNITVKYNLR